VISFLFGFVAKQRASPFWLVRSKKERVTTMTTFRKSTQSLLQDVRKALDTSYTKLTLPKYEAGDKDDENKYGKQRRKLSKRDRRLLAILSVLFGCYVVKKMIFPLNHEQMKVIDEFVRDLWRKAETSGIIPAFPVYQTDYLDDFPDFKLLEDNYQTIKAEAEELLMTTREHIPRLKDLVVAKRSQGHVYHTDWKVCEYCLLLISL
jgi:hypothetical protein